MSTNPHCWKGKEEWLEDQFGYLSPQHLDYMASMFDADGPWYGQRIKSDSTCMLPAGHDGPHEWTSDGDITITFGPAPAPGREALSDRKP